MMKSRSTILTRDRFQAVFYTLLAAAALLLPEYLFAAGNPERNIADNLLQLTRPDLYQSRREVAANSEAENDTDKVIEQAGTEKTEQTAIREESPEE